VHLRAVVAHETLEDRAVLGVHRQERHAPRAGGRGHEGPRHDERLLVGERHRLPRPDRRHGGEQARPAHDGGEHEVGVHLAREGNQPRRAAEDLGMGPRQQPGHRGRRPRVGEGECAWTVLEAEVGHELGVGAAGGEALDAEVAGELVHQLQGPAPHRAGGAEEDEPLHAGPRAWTA
jgi:hypothetical protein